MGDDQVTSGRTRGEHGRGPALDLLTEQGHGTFVSLKVEQLAVRLWDEVKQVVNGEVIKQKHAFAKFQNHTWVAPSKKHADAMKQTAAFRKGKVRTLLNAKEETKAQKASKLSKALEADPELAEAFDQLRKGKGTEPTVTPKKEASKGAKKDSAKEPKE